MVMFFSMSLLVIVWVSLLMEMAVMETMARIRMRETNRVILKNSPDLEISG